MSNMECTTTYYRELRILVKIQYWSFWSQKSIICSSRMRTTGLYSGGLQPAASLILQKSLLASTITTFRSRTSLGARHCGLLPKKSHREVLEFLSEVCGLTSLEKVSLPDHGHDAVYDICNVCTSPISAADFHFYHCEYCSNGNWCVCEDCWKRGAHCAEETHTLTEIIKEGQNWVEITD